MTKTMPMPIPRTVTVPMPMKTRTASTASSSSAVDSASTEEVGVSIDADGFPLPPPPPAPAATVPASLGLLIPLWGACAVAAFAATPPRKGTSPENRENPESPAGVNDLVPVAGAQESTSSLSRPRSQTNHDDGSKVNVSNTMSDRASVAFMDVMDSIFDPAALARRVAKSPGRSTASSYTSPTRSSSNELDASNGDIKHDGDQGQVHADQDQDQDQDQVHAFQDQEHGDHGDASKAITLAIASALASPSSAISGAGDTVTAAISRASAVHQARVVSSDDVAALSEALSGLNVESRELERWLEDEVAPNPAGFKLSDVINRVQSLVARSEVQADQSLQVSLRSSIDASLVAAGEELECEEVVMLGMTAMPADATGSGEGRGDSGSGNGKVSATHMGAGRWSVKKEKAAGGSSVRDVAWTAPARQVKALAARGAASVRSVASPVSGGRARKGRTKKEKMRGSSVRIGGLAALAATEEMESVIIPVSVGPESEVEMFLEEVNKSGSSRAGAKRKWSERGGLDSPMQYLKKLKKKAQQQLSRRESSSVSASASSKITQKDLVREMNSIIRREETKARLERMASKAREARTGLEVHLGGLFKRREEQKS